MAKVFISYVRENRPVVEKLVSDLKAYGLDVRTDFSIPPGKRWKSYLRQEICNGDFFVACFSEQYTKKPKSYMNEELTIAIEQARLRSPEVTWMIPVRIDSCAIPSREIGGGERLDDLQYVDLFKDWQSGVAKIAAAAGATKIPHEGNSYPTNTSCAAEPLDYDAEENSGDSDAPQAGVSFYPTPISVYAQELLALGLTPEKLGQCVSAGDRYTNNTKFKLGEVKEILFRHAPASELSMVPRHEFLEGWSYEIHLLEVVSFVGHGGMLFVDVVPQNFQIHEYDSGYTRSGQSGVQIGDAIRNFSQTSLNDSSPDILQDPKRGGEIVAAVLFRWEFDGSKYLDRSTLEVIQID